MPYRIELGPEALPDLLSLRKTDQQRVRALLPRYLTYEPAAPSHMGKVLDPNPYDASWELRLGDLRVLYAIDEATQVVSVLRVGRKEGNRLYLRGIARGIAIELRLSP